MSEERYMSEETRTEKLISTVTKTYDYCDMSQETLKWNTPKPKSVSISSDIYTTVLAQQFHPSANTRLERARPRSSLAGKTIWLQDSCEQFESPPLPVDTLRQLICVPATLSGASSFSSFFYRVHMVNL